MKQRIIIAVGIMLALVSQAVNSDPAGATVTAGDTLTATKMNEIINAVNDNDTTITDLTNTVKTLQTNISNLQATISSLQSDLGKVQSNSVLALDDNLVYTVVNGYATARFTGVNVQVINGVGQTTVNGLGNLIVGYNGATSSTTTALVCSSSTYETQSECETTGNVWSRNHKTGSHNMVGGTNNSYSSHGGLIFGTQNIVNAASSSVSGGYSNIASDRATSVSGGYKNIASGDRSSISGGWNHLASGLISSVTGGESNKATGQMSAVHGGFSNTASGKFSSVLGGRGINNSVDFGTSP